MNARRLACCAVFNAALPGIILAQPCEVAKLQGDTAWLSSFGTAVAISGDYAVVGDGGDSQMGSNAGAAYIFHRVGNDWQRQQKIFGSGTGFDDLFGASVAIDGDRIVVGAPVRVLDVVNLPGYAFVFQRQSETWVETQKLISSGSAPNDEFGYSVSISGDWLAVGAPAQNNFIGLVYLFQWNGSTYVETASVVGADTGQENFGEVISLDQNRLLVGVPIAPPGGAAYVFKYEGSTWSQEVKLTASDAAQGDAFGYSVSVSGDYAIVGAPGTDHTGSAAGSAYIFRDIAGSWAQVENLHGSNPKPGAEFGNAVSVVGALAVVGAYFRNSAVFDDDVGAAFVFANTSGSWVELGRFVPPDASPFMTFAQAISFDGNQAIIGAFSSTYIYAVPNGPPCIPAVGGEGILLLAILVLSSGVLLVSRRLLRKHMTS